jgi:hypothetical protein
MLLGPLGEVFEHELALGQGDVILRDGGQAEGAVLLGVLFASGPEEAEVDQAYRGRQDSFPAQAPST